MRNICVIGVGYVGLVTGTAFADLGNKVIAVDVSEEKIEKLLQGVMPIYEPGLQEVVQRNVNAGRLQFSSTYADGLKDAEFVFICVGTPQGVDGEADLKYVRAAAEEIAKTMDHPLIIINKSTVPVGTGDWVANIVRENQPQPIEFAVVSCPEFLREGSAVKDFFNPERIVLGSTDRAAADRVAQLHLSLRAPIVVTDLRTAEMIKYASNAFLATKISFINEIANICEALGADVKEVANGMGYDTRIGNRFLEAGVGYGGSCFTPEETLFAVNGDSVKAISLEDLFTQADKKPFKGDAVEVINPQNLRVLGFDPETGCPEVVTVHALTRRPYQGNMVTLKTSMGRVLTVTADHPVLLYESGQFKIKLAAEVEANDTLMALTQMPPLDNTVPAELNLIELLKGTVLADDVYVSPINAAFTEQYSTFAKHIPNEMLKHPHEVRRHNRMSLRLYYHLQEKGVLDVPADDLQLYTAKGAATKINAVIPIDGDFLRFCGYYLAEGCIAKEEGRAGSQRERVLLTFHEDEHEYIQDSREILTRYGLKFIEQNSTHAITTIVSSRILAWLLRDVLGCGINSNNKALPRIAFGVDEYKKAELIRGMFSGDGSVTPVQQGRNLMLEYATTSRLLAHGFSMLLQSVGIIPSIRHRMMNKSKHLAYILRISGYDQIMRLQNAFGEKQQKRIQNILAGYQRKIEQRGFKQVGTVALLDVLEVQAAPADQTVYSLETNTGVVILGSGLVMKQCFPKDVQALAYMAQVHGTHPQLLQAVMDINETQRKRLVLKLEDIWGSVKGKTVALLGLAFKENTDDMRESPSISIADYLHGRGAKVRAYDPVAMEESAKIMPYLEFATDSYDLAKDADAILVLTPWNEFKQLDMERIKNAMREPVLIDGRNLYEPDRMRAMGFTYRGVGRGYNGTKTED